MKSKDFSDNKEFLTEFFNMVNFNKLKLKTKVFKTSFKLNL
jgi:hypothetical protein